VQEPQQSFRLEIPDAWRALDISGWHGSVLVFGAVDSGKSTFSKYLYTRLLSYRRPVGYLDTDVGQNSLGLPTTLMLALNGESKGFPPVGPRRMYFVGNNTPSGSMLPVLTGIYRLMLFAVQHEVEALVVDTSGLVDPASGGAALKWSKVELFRPCIVVGLQNERELEPILAPLRRRPGVRLYELPVCRAVRSRSRDERRAYRAARYRDYFGDARRIPLPYRRLAVFPDPKFTTGRLVALEGRDGFVLALGLVERADDRVVWLRTPWPAKGRVAALRLGYLRIDLDTFQDAPI